MTFISETTIKAIRKARHCDGCGKMVEVGASAIRWAGVTDGSFGTALYHPECRVAEVAYNRMIGSHYDEWVPLSDLELDDNNWLRAEHPVVADRILGAS